MCAASERRELRLPVDWSPPRLGTERLDATPPRAKNRAPAMSWYLELFANGPFGYLSLLTRCSYVGIAGLG
jgi:hypothetical protein